MVSEAAVSPLAGCGHLALGKERDRDPSASSAQCSVWCAQSAGGNRGGGEQPATSSKQSRAEQQCLGLHRSVRVGGLLWAHAAGTAAVRFEWTRADYNIALCS